MKKFTGLLLTAIFLACLILFFSCKKKSQDDVMQSNFRGTVGTLLNQKFGRKHTNRSGISFVRLFYNSNIKTVNPLTGVYSQVNQGSGNSDLLQAFSESKIDVTNVFSVNAGLYFQYFLLNRHYSIEPRLAVRWQFAGKHAFSLGYGKHSISEDVGVYLIEIQISPEVTTP